ncbi:sigma-70 family RNA polymerase sigma factor [Streptomyces sp. AC536]|uniref:BACON domain-containing protein n=1 Tax=Streptomyces buecherae TaxID=2763006 RepID=UPI00164E8AA7|nr:sigma-70 family RNA polymerase sigma factor [Streptomyces buecherae]MBC3982678.1 sigma-70 family RNA polymerase sigma factor [Streptomyces buecherae]QNJ41616.1 sigma-70 family RNA polymerase sigma factor [Streptomyces buecherae]
MSSRPEHPTHPTGAHRAQRRGARAPRTAVERPPACYEPYLDGLFTYCLSVLCDHDAATVALGDALAVAERRRQRGRAAGFTAKDSGADPAHQMTVPPPMTPPMAPELSVPPGRARAPGHAKRSPATDLGLRRPWLYALARWACLRALAEARAGGAAPRGGAARAAHSVQAPTAPAQRRRDLAALAWPEAAGTTPEQREALELAVRHQLSPHEVAAVIGLDPDDTRALIASAACEVERTRAALAVVELGRCPTVSRLAGDAQVLLSAALRRELVRHVDDCGQCRRTAERATAGGPWPGTAAAPAALPILEAPRSAVCAAMQRALRGRPTRAAATWPRFDRRGFPIDPKDRAARRARLRSRAVTTTVVATVVAAPVLALWAAYRGAPLTGESQANGGVSATERDEFGGQPYEEAGHARGNQPDADAGRRSPGDRDRAEERARQERRGDPRPTDRVPSRGPATPPSTDRPEPGTNLPAPAPGHLTVTAQPGQDTTLITLSASGGSPVSWSATSDAPWLRLSQSAGELRPGESLTITASVDHGLEPAGPWTAHVSVAPSGSVVTIQGVGQGSGPDPSPTPPEPTPTPTPTPTPSEPAPAPSEPASPSP